jgi:hypothetical protein
MRFVRKQQHHLLGLEPSFLRGQMARKTSYQKDRPASSSEQQALYASVAAIVVSTARLSDWSATGYAQLDHKAFPGTAAATAQRNYRTTPALVTGWSASKLAAPWSAANYPKIERT